MFDKSHVESIGTMQYAMTLQRLCLWQKMLHGQRCVSKMIDGHSCAFSLGLSKWSWEPVSRNENVDSTDLGLNMENWGSKGRILRDQRKP